MSLNKVNKQTGETSPVAGLGGSSGGHTIQNESGTDLTQRDTMQFTGQAKATDDSTNGKTIIDVSPEVIDWDDWRQMTDQEKEAIPEALIEDAPGVDGLLSANLLTKLWENPNPTAAFAAQNASLASNDYDILACIYAYQKDNLLRCNSILLEKGNNAVLESSNVSGDSNYIFINNRKLYTVSDGTYKNISFGSNIYRRVDQTSSQGTVDNNVNIPIAIYGIKKTINLEFSAIASDVSTSADKCMLSDGVTSVEDKVTANNYDTAAAFDLPTDGTIVTFGSDGYIQLNATYGSSNNLIYVKIYGKTGTGALDVHCQGNSTYTDSSVVFVRKGMRASVPTVTGTAKASFIPLIV